jgi:predicted amidohydrolase YtcJ
MLTGQTAEVLGKALVVAEVPLRVRLIDFPERMAGWRRPPTRARTAPHVTSSGTKWILDGTPVERLMFLRQPFADRVTSRGRANFPAAATTGFLRAALAAGEQPMFHAVGDAAIDLVLDALEGSGAEKWRELRPRIEHGDMFEPGHFDRAKRLGVVVVQNPAHFMLPDLMKMRLGERSGRVTMMKSMIAAGIPVALGSDGPPNPFLNMMFATINANNPAEAMTREQVLSAYTLGSALAEREDAEKGTLAAGKLADLAILSQDIFAVPADQLPATRSIMTVIGGRVVHEANR